MDLLAASNSDFKFTPIDQGKDIWFLARDLNQTLILSMIALKETVAWFKANYENARKWVDDPVCLGVSSWIVICPIPRNQKLVLLGEKARAL